MFENKTRSRKRKAPQELDDTSKLSKYKDVRIKDSLIGRRVAHFLDWAAVNMPKRYFQYNLICKQINELNKTPPQGDKQVDLVRRSMTSAKRILLKRYGRGIDFMRGVGVRATTDSVDILNRPLVSCVAKEHRAHQRTEDLIAMVDETKLPPKDYAYFMKIKRVAHEIGQADIQKLLPPKK
jgi:hypothetical protein